MLSKQANADKTYTYIKNGIKIVVAIIPGVPNEAKIIEPLLDIVYNNMKWAGLFKTDLTISQEIAFRKTLEKTFKEITKSLPTNKRLLLERARPEIESMLNENIHEISSLDITDRIIGVIERPVHTEGDFFIDKDFDALTTLFLNRLEKNLDNTPLADTLLRERVDELRIYIIEKFKENESEHADFLHRIQELESLPAKVEKMQLTLDAVVKMLSVIMDPKDTELLKYVRENLHQFDTIELDSYNGVNSVHVLIPISEVFKKPISPYVKKVIISKKVLLNYNGVDLNRDSFSVSSIISQIKELEE